MLRNCRLGMEPQALQVAPPTPPLEGSLLLPVASSCLAGVTLPGTQGHYGLVGGSAASQLLPAGVEVGPQSAPWWLELSSHWLKAFCHPFPGPLAGGMLLWGQLSWVTLSDGCLGPESGEHDAEGDPGK